MNNDYSINNSDGEKKIILNHGECKIIFPWINVKNKLPKMDEWVFIFCGNHPKPVRYYQAKLSNIENHWFVPFINRLLLPCEVTYWMPLPEPPNE